MSSERPSRFERIALEVQDAESVQDALQVFQLAYGVDFATYHLALTIVDIVDTPYVRTTYRPSRPEAAILANSQNVVGTRRGGLTREVPGRDIALQFEERFNEYGYFEFGHCRPMEPELRRHRFRQF